MEIAQLALSFNTKVAEVEMSPRREYFKTRDGRNYTLWADINDAMSAIVPAYWSDDRENRKEHGWMFRGQIDLEWGLVPSLYRPPIDDSILKERQNYTSSFIDSLKEEARRFRLERLSDAEYLAIAQHYGFYTLLLDFTWNAEVAAYFATMGGQPGKVGAIWGFNYKEYQEMRNPFAALGLSLEESDEAFKDGGLEPLPDLEIIELYEVPRIYAQEGIFVRVTPEKMNTVMHECIDRFYFRQRQGIIYSGRFAHKAHTLPSRHHFANDESHEAFLSLVRDERPDLFDQTDTFDARTLFPPADPLSKFAEIWRNEHPDRLRKVTPFSIGMSHLPSSPPGGGTMKFFNQIEGYYYGDFSKSPYEEEYLSEGRELLESLSDCPELDNPQTQSWLLWELYKRNLPAGLTCTLKLGNARSWSRDLEGVRFVIVDRWLSDSYQCTLSWEQLESSFCQITFGDLDQHGRPKVSVCQIDPFSPPRTTERKPPVNPWVKARAPHLLHTIEARLAGLDEGVVGSFLYDFHHVVMLSMGRNLVLVAAVVDEGPCLQRSPLTRPEHEGPILLVRVTDQFTGGITHTAVCNKHWDCMSEGDVDVMQPLPWTLLGLA